MFPTLTNHSTTTSTPAGVRQQTTVRAVIALAGLALAASACGGSPGDAESAIAVDGLPGLPSAVVVDERSLDAPTVDAAAPTSTPTIGEVGIGDSTGTSPDTTPPQPAVDDTAPVPTPQSPQQPQQQEQPPQQDEPDTGPAPSTSVPPADNGTDAPPEVPEDGNTGPLAPVDPSGIQVSSPAMNVAAACFATGEPFIWSSTGATALVFDDLNGGVNEGGNVRGPLTFDSQNRGGPLLTEGIDAIYDELRGFAVTYSVRGQVGDIVVEWAGTTGEAGGVNSQSFVSESNPQCFITLGFRITLDDEPETQPPGDFAQEQAPSADDFAQVRPEADIEVAVRPVKVNFSETCFTGQFELRTLHTFGDPVTVMVDTNGISTTKTTTRAHPHTEVTADLATVAISDGAIEAFANAELGYDITVDVQMVGTFGLEFEWVAFVNRPGTYTSPTFSPDDSECDVWVDFLVIEREL